MLKPNYRLWLFAEGHEGVFGDGKLRLLEAIAQCGSLREAAKTMDISYRKAWGDIKKAEACLGLALVDRSRGGASGGSSRLTDEAGRLIAAFRNLRRAIDSSVETHFRTFNQEIRR